MKFSISFPHLATNNLQKTKKSRNFVYNATFRHVVKKVKFKSRQRTHNKIWNKIPEKASETIILRSDLKKIIDQKMAPPVIILSVYRLDFVMLPYNFPEKAKSKEVNRIKKFDNWIKRIWQQCSFLCFPALLGLRFASIDLASFVWVTVSWDHSVATRHTFTDFIFSRNYSALFNTIWCFFIKICLCSVVKSRASQKLRICSLLTHQSSDI